MATTLLCRQQCITTSQYHGVPILGRSGLDSAAGNSFSSTQTTSLLHSSKLTNSLSANQITDLNNNLNIERYKTELCHNFQESGFCKYGTKCQYAHYPHEMRPVSRHPKYKTEMCRTYHMTGFCHYGTRCHFIHDQQDRQRCHKSATQHSTAPSSTLTSCNTSPVNGPLHGPSSSQPTKEECHQASVSSLAVIIPPPVGYSSTPGVQSGTSTRSSINSSLLSFNRAPMDSLLTGLKASHPSCTTIVQDCLNDMYFSPTSPVCQADVSDTNRLAVFKSLCKEKCN